MEIQSRIRRFLSKRTQEANLSEQFFVTLRANWGQVKKVNPNVDNAVAERVENLLNDGSGTWSEAYEVERLLFDLYDSTMLDVELGRRMVEAKRTLVEDEYAYYLEEEKHLTADARQASGTEELCNYKRSLLNRLVNDLQWRFSIQQTKRVHSLFIRNFTSIVFVLSTVVFLVVLCTCKGSTNFHIWVSLVTGIWGASFSMIVSLNTRLKQGSLEDLRLLRSVSYVFSRVAIGIGASLILNFFMCSSLLEGTMFPDLQSLRTIQTGQGPDYKNLSLLTIWSFIAGFSEKFVPNLLSKTESQANPSAS